jgi:alpha-tubulin suppressor-like RCC1 family protein/subtilisin family serine protease
VKIYKRKFFAMICILVILLSNAVPMKTASAEGNEAINTFQTDAAASVEKETSDKEKKKEQSKTKKVVKYGPYRELNNQHAYEPFKEKEEKEALGVDIGYRKDRLLVKFDDEATPIEVGKYTINGKTVDVKQKGLKEIEPLISVKKKAAKSKIEKSLEGWHRAYVAKDKKIEDVVESLKKDPTVESVEYDYLRNIDSTEVPEGLNDENLGQQWHMETAAIKQAWKELETQGINPGGNRDVVVAVIDTGVDYNHPDIKGNMWINTGEVPNNGYDDDQNGFIDDIHGATTVGDRWNGESGNPNDDHGHGTHVAGIIAAQGNNEIGGAGIAYNTQIMAIKAAQSSGALSSSDIAQAIYYAVDKGADVINMSFGGYGRSTVEEDALQVAFGTSVLVAAAGNDGKPNLPHPLGADMFPAAYNWVLGVMAEQQQPDVNGDYLAGFSNWDFKAQDSHEYEVMAPGADIYSTLPNGKYAKWSGTSMAAPVVAGIAALVRSKFEDKNSYSSRFIMGQIAATGTPKQGITYDMKKPPLVYKSVNALQALTNTPKPQLSYLEHYLFDKENVAPGNDGDGVIDAGETIDIAMVIRNHWGKADNVEVKIDTLGSGGMADPYITLLSDTVNYGAVGNFAIDDNGLIYENDVVTGVNLPFKIQAAPNTPNDHIVPINVTITGRNGFDPKDATVYTYNSGFSVMVRNGVELPGVIDKDMTLTNDKYWIVPNATLIQEGVTVTVEPGTQIQFWSAEPEDPYGEKSLAYIEVRGKFLVNGTAENPVEMFPSSMYPEYEVKVYSTGYLDYYGYSNGYRGYAEINYAKIMNPNIALQKVDHSYFSQDHFDYINKRILNNGKVETISWYGPAINVDLISNSRFYSLGSATTSTWQPSYFNIKGKSIGNLFDSSRYYFDEVNAIGNVYLKNYKLIEQQYGNRSYAMSMAKNFGYKTDHYNFLNNTPLIKNNENGSTYLTAFPSQSLPLDTLELFKVVEKFANDLGGHIATINDMEENNFIQSYVQSYVGQNPIIGLNDIKEESKFEWVSDENLTYANWDMSEPDNKYSDYTPSNFVKLNKDNGKWYDYFPTDNFSVYMIEIPGIANVTDVSLDKTSVTLGAGGATLQLKAIISPTKATNKTVNWLSSDPNIASVDQNGVVTPKFEGKATITVTTEDGGYTASTEVSVIEIIPATGVSLNIESLELSKGQQGSINATVKPENSTDKRVKWSSSDESIAKVDESGIVTGISNGRATITVTTLDGGFTASANVIVLIPVDGIKLDQEFLRMVMGDTPIKMNPIILTENATNTSVKWDSSNENVVKVSEDGYITPTGIGTAKITVTSEQGNYSASSIVTVWENQVNFNTIDIAAGGVHSLALNEDGSVWAWGDNRNGRLGDGTYSNRLTPIKVPNLPTIKSIAAGGEHSLALSTDGYVYAWGHGGYGQLGIGNYESANSIQVLNLKGITQIAAAGYHSVALKSDGTVWTWGNNGSGQLGDGTTTNRWTPVQVNNLTNVKSITAGEKATYAIKSDGTVWSWGNNGNGQLGDGTITNRLSPTQVKNITSIKAVDAGEYHVIALKSDGTVWGWGNGGYGQIGNGYPEYKIPVQIQGIEKVTRIVAGMQHSIVIKDDKSVWAFGRNYEGQLGNGINGDHQYIATQIKDILATDVEAGYYHTIITKDDGTVWSFGRNIEGQLGNLTTENSNKPVQTLFGILPDTEMPQLDTKIPENNAVNVSLNSSIKFIFNEGIKSGDNYPLITLRDQNYETISFKSKTIENNVLILDPINQLSENTSYTLTVPANSITDVFNNSYNQDIYLTFTTAPYFSSLSVKPKSKTKKLSYFELIQKISKKSVISITSNLRKKGKKENDNIHSVDSKDISEVNTNTGNELTKEKSQITKPIQNTNITSSTAGIDITQSIIDEKKKAFFNSGILSTIKDNAILNRWWDPNVDNWMRFTSEEGELSKRFLSGNYWGTTSTELIEKSLIHFNDFRNMEEIIYKPILTTAPETAYPFVTDVYVSTESQERATKVGSENIEIHVTFNRDMDQSVQPQVSFGPDMPTTDYTVHGVNGGWITPRHWVGSMKITSMTGDGYQFFRVAGAVAADDPWLVTGNDTERFRFEIVTSGTEAMNLQASGAEGKVVLSWSQDDFETLAGYNIYRSESRDGGFEKINSSVIPSDQKIFEDTEVVPGKMYFYKFTVVKTNLTESEFSNIASAAPVDTIIPTISHTPKLKANVGQPVQIFADVTDNVKVEKVTLFYKSTNETSYKQKEMVKSTNNRYSVTLEGALILPPSLDYYIEATDGASKALNGNANQPHRIVISDLPTITSVTPMEGPETGGTKVVINGANFKAGATVLFGQAAASEIVVVNSNQITAVTPAHFPAKVDVQVKNPDGKIGKLLGGFTFISEGVEVTVPNVIGNTGDIIEVPVLINNVSGLRSVDFKVKFNPNLLSVEKVALGNLTNKFSLASNKNVSGEVQISMASSAAVNGSGSIAMVSFKVLDSEQVSSSITLDALSFNSGSIKVNPINGEFSIGQSYKVQGYVNYYSNYQAVSNVMLDLLGTSQSQTFTDVSGGFNFDGVKKGDYRLTASKNDDINGISAYDASLILQAAVNLTYLSEYQKIAADVDKNGRIDALDAAYVLEKSVDLITLPFPGAGDVWEFVPNEKTIHVASDLTYQNFTAILIGDVNGDWGTGTTNLSSAYNVGTMKKDSDDFYFVPIEYNVGDAELYSAKLSFSFDPTKVVPVVVEKTDVTRDYSVVANVKNGVIEVALAGTSPIKGSGELIQIKMKTLSKERKQTATKVNLLSANINDKGIILKSFKANKDQEQRPKTKVLWTADVLGDGLTYSWVLYNGKKGIDKQGFSKQNYFEYVLSEPGEYNLLMLVRNQYGEEISQMSETITIVAEEKSSEEGKGNGETKVEDPKSEDNGNVIVDEPESGENGEDVEKPVSRDKGEFPPIFTTPYPKTGIDPDPLRLRD